MPIPLWHTFSIGLLLASPEMSRPMGQALASAATAPSPTPAATPTSKGSILDLFRKIPAKVGPSDLDLIAGLKEALVLGAGAATKELGRTDGFMSNSQVKIPVPEKLRPIDSALRKLKLAWVADQFVESLNRAAEQSVPAALSILGDAVKAMSIADAKGILAGPPDAATQYLKRSSHNSLREAFLPIVAKATAQAGVASSYKTLLAKAGPLAKLSGAEGQDLDGYVTEKALDGLYLLIAVEEKKIREDPKARVTEILRKVFGR